MLCGTAGAPASTISIVSCNGEDAADGDNNPVNGAFMTWLATDSNNFYYSRIYNGADTFQIVRTGTNLTVYAPSEPDGISYMASLNIGGNSSNQCLQPGTWTVQVWDVLDDDGDQLPDRDADGNIIGCFVLCDFDFFPSCPLNDDTRFDVEVENVGCNGDGSITLSDFTSPNLYCVESNGTGATFSWTGPNGFASSDRTITGLEAGTYTVEVADFYGCISRWTGDISTLAPLTIDCSNPSTPPSTVGGSDGMADINITSGTGDYSITWTGPVGGAINNAVDGVNVVTGLEQGTYTFTVTDEESGCTEMCMVTVDEPPCFVDFTVMLDADRNIVITVLEGIPNFILSYVGPTNNTLSTPFGNEGVVVPAINFVPGDYEFILIEEDRTICRFSVFFTIDPIDCSDLQFSVLDVHSPVCGGTNDGLIDIFFEGDFFPDLVWTGPDVDGLNSRDLFDLEPGIYSFVITDSRGCTRDSSFTLTAPPELFFDCGAVDETLAALNNGKIGYAVTGGTGPFSLAYTATDPDGNPLPNGGPMPIAVRDTLRDLQAGTYVLTVTDMNGCTNECMATVSEPNCSLAPDCTVTNPVMAGGNGSVALDFDGVAAWNVTITGPKDTSFVTPNAMVSIDDLPQGDYTLNVFNSDGCVGTCSFSVVGPMCELNFTAVVGAPSCVDAADGTVALTINNAAAGLVIDWDNDAFDGMTTVTGLMAGSYSVTVTDQTGCSVAPQIFMLTDPAPLVVDLSLAEAVQCAGDSTAVIVATVVGSVGELMYDWSVDSLPDTNRVTGLIAGSYHVLVTDMNGCTGRDTIIISQPESLELSCSATGETAAGSVDGTITLGNTGGDAGAGGVVQLSGDLGDRFITAGTDTVFTSLPPGTYSFTITDANDCTAICSAIVSQGGCEIAVTILPSQPDCDNVTGGATANVIDANGMTTYLWSTGAPTQMVDDLAPGDYAVTVTDALGCEARADVTIIPFTDFPVLENLSLSEVCDDGCTELSFTVTGSPPFVARVLVERNGTVFGEVPFSIPAVGAGFTSFCPAIFGYPDLQGFTVSFVDITDANGCSRDVIQELDASVFAAAVSTLDTMICAGNQLDYFGEVFDATRTTGDVVVPTPSANGCDSTVMVNLDFYPQVTGLLDTSICAGETFRYAGRDFNTAIANELVILPGVASFGCDSLVSLTVNIIEATSLIIAGNSVICSGGDLEFTIENTGNLPTDIVLSTSPGTVQTLPPNSVTPYQLSVSVGTLVDIISVDNGTQCSPTINGAFTVTESNLSVSIDVMSGDGVFGVSCADGSDGALLAIATGGQAPYGFEWSTGASGADLNELGAGRYSIVVTGGSGCTADALVVLDEPNALVTAIAEVPADCRDTLPRLIVRDVQGGVGPYLYRTNNDAPFVPFINLPDTLTAAVGRNDFSLEDANGCLLEQSFELAGPPPSELVVSPTRSVVTQGDSIELQLLTNLDVDGFSIFPGPESEVAGQSIFVNPLETTTYTFSIIDPSGCTATAEAEVFIDDFVPIYAPSAFSPNDDGTNDVFRIYAKPVVASFSNFTVFDRWGHQVYERPESLAGPADDWGWDGRNAAGKAHQAAVYVYSIDVNLQDGRVITVKGDFVLMR
jgi:gliding motility-associated-like protein